MRSLLLLGLAAVWWLAIDAWPTLPARIPMHFGLGGAPDRWADTSLWSWFLFPAMATVFAFALGHALPAWMRRLAAANSKLLNVPDAARFRALPTAQRVSVVQRAALPLAVMGLEVEALFAWLVFGTARVARDEWRALPVWPVLVCVGAILVSAVHMALATKAAVRSAREGCGVVGPERRGD
ncbi:MAG: DUF1648 domain-containing protein [Planctomycetes bacterium]|nr:DUF1648 domain-containing protein [Planctomycetota bacterium]